MDTGVEPASGVDPNKDKVGDFLGVGDGAVVICVDALLEEPNIEKVGDFFGAEDEGVAGFAFGADLAAAGEAPKMDSVGERLAGARAPWFSTTEGDDCVGATFFSSSDAFLAAAFCFASAASLRAASAAFRNSSTLLLPIISSGADDFSED